MDLCARAAVALLRAAKEQGRRFLLDGDRAVERYCAAAKHAVELAGAGDRAPLAVRLFRDAVGVAHCAADAGAAVGPPQALLLQLVDAIAAAGEPRPWDWDCLRACAEEAPPPVSAVLAFSLRKLGAAA
uniref:Uncharacterized protein n=2 Tax=Tetraselmis sp. GSL018 TaxID=582737 RepID=A0A061QHE8_9CHLO